MGSECNDEEEEKLGGKWFFVIGDGFLFGDEIMIHGREGIMDEKMGFMVLGFDWYGVYSRSWKLRRGMLMNKRKKRLLG